ncbi:MAG: Dabb family protein [Vicinamibacterales bacterium]
MIAHIVLFKPRPDLSRADREALLGALRIAFTNIPEIRRARVGRRTMLGRAYDSLARIDFECAAVLEFETEAALRAYLDHPAHVDLGRRFSETSEVALVYDFEMIEPDEIGKWTA